MGRPRSQIQVSRRVRGEGRATAASATAGAGRGGAAEGLAGPPRRPRRGRPRRQGGGRGPWLLALLAAGGLLWLSRGLLLPTPPRPQLILVLGGDVARERAAGELARRDGLPLLVSGGSNPEYATWQFGRQGLGAGRVQLDYRAHDTLTNFTSVVDELRRAKVRHVLLVTSSDHMERALLVGRIVAGSRGIHLTPVAVPCGDQCHPEGRRKVWGDGARAALWVLSGRDVRDWAARRFAPLLEPAARS
ncbi:YdcF family protein [Vulcanococcus limneticus]|uniref:YdcF family protein n=1 Tax=Vulcanococcus limneticus TaxID=2170428 RepID=UPI00398BC192